MLKINKILSKKIKFPLSLRGAEQACPCESRGSNLSGFSLIELMIAAAILAMAIFGIFHAYSVGFMGMADARDRTVATNYAREAMEDVKNMDFEKITTTTKSVITSNIKYRVDVNVSLENPNLKKVFTVVGWKDRNGVGKTVETSMLVNYTEIYASEAAKIVLYADSYSILNTSSMGGATFTNLTAVIKDIKGNTIIDWGTRTGEGDITFTITDRPELGYLNEIIGAPSGATTISIEPTEGRASTFFTSSGSDLGITEVGYSEITASVNLPIIGNVSDSVTIKITDGPVKIKFSPPNPDIIKASTNNYSTITVSLCNAANQILNKSDLVTDVEITFSVFGEGILSTPTITIPAVIGDGSASADIILNSTGTPGLVSVVATVTDLESDTADVRFLGLPVSISISADPNPMYVDDNFSTITVSLLDVNGFCTNPTGGNIGVTFLLLPNTNGSLFPSSLSFTANEYEGIPETTDFSGQHSTEDVTITTENGVGLTDGSVTIKFLSSLEPDHIELKASSQNVVTGGSSIITATVCDSEGITVTNYDGTITFATTLGVFSDSNTVDVDNGVATTVLTSTSPGNAIITITYPDPAVLPFNPSDGLVVGFYGGADHIKLTASSQEVVTGGSSIITATVCDLEFIHVSNYIGTIIFNTDFGTFSVNPPEVYTTNGIATIELYSEEIGTATITASSSDGLVCIPSEGVVVEFYEETTLTLTEEPIQYDSTNKVVTFYVNVAGGMITVDEMKIIWTESGPQERFSKILIDEVEVYTGSVKSGTIVDIIDDVVLSIKEEGHTIELTFLQDMAGRQIDVMFYPSSGWYLIRFDVP